MAEGHRGRVMEDVFENGIESMREHQFLEMCLYSVYKRCDTNPIAHELLNRFGNLEAVCNATEDELVSVKGVGPTAARYIRLLPYIAKGYAMHTSTRRSRKYDTKESMCQRCISLLKGNKNEVAYVLCFDSAYHLIKEVKIGEGTPGAVYMDPRKIMDAIANTSTTKILICHNHPSGVHAPSRQDYVSTSNIKSFVSAVGVELIDHIAVTDDDYVSCVVID